MDITPQLATGRTLIQGYGGGAFVISQQRYEHSVIVFPTKVLAWDGSLAEESLWTIAEQAVDTEILIIGAGAEQQFISPALKEKMKTCYGVMLEVMNTGAACRTFNVLQSEDRRVAAALVVV